VGSVPCQLPIDARRISLDGAASKARVPMDDVGRMLTLDEAKQVLKRLEAGRQE
jgi:hypothetical protein